MCESRRRAVRVVAAVAATAAMAMACGGADDHPGTLVATLQGGERLYSGELNADAVAEARDYRPAVALWLGESFNGLYLSHAQELNGELLLVYGACRAAPGDGEPSCVPPLQIQVFPRGAVPPVARVDPVPFRGVHRTRGELGPNSDQARSAMLWLPDGGTVKLYIESHVLGDIIDEALGALETANHDALGLDAVGPGGSLVGLTP